MKGINVIVVRLAISIFQIVSHVIVICQALIFLNAKMGTAVYALMRDNVIVK